MSGVFEKISLLLSYSLDLFSFLIILIDLILLYLLIAFLKDIFLSSFLIPSINFLFIILELFKSSEYLFLKILLYDFLKMSLSSLSNELLNFDFFPFFLFSGIKSKNKFAFNNECFATLLYMSIVADCKLFLVFLF